MSIEHHSGFNSDAHIQELDGDILPYVDPPDYLANLPDLEKVDTDQLVFDYDETKPDTNPLIDPVVANAMADADAKEKAYLHKGYSPERAKELTGRGRKLAMLLVRGHDISRALPPEQSESATSEPEFTPDQERQYNLLVDTGGFTPELAKRKVLGR